MPMDWSKDTVAYYYHCKFYLCYFHKKNHDQAKSFNLLYLWIVVDKFCFSVTCEFHRNRLLCFWDNVTEKADYRAIAIRSFILPFFMKSEVPAVFALRICELVYRSYDQCAIEIYTRIWQNKLFRKTLKLPYSHKRRIHGVSRIFETICIITTNHWELGILFNSFICFLYKKWVKFTAVM